MCGIAGFFDPRGRSTAAQLEALARAMSDSLRHRGPDAGGVFADPAAGVAFGHRRLSIVDLSPAGAQPMTSADGRFVLSYNGEVYNARELGAQLEARGARFRGHSDTEVIVEGFATWGVGETVRRLIGMFAFSVWDRVERELTLGRDRMGIKPLYWGVSRGTLLFGSELKALGAHPAFAPEIDRDALSAYLRLLYVPGPGSIFRGVHKLGPGTLLRVGSDLEPRAETWWDLRRVARDGVAHPLELGDDEATAELDRLLRDAVGRRMIADVPLGAFLSGGIDSSTVVALMQAQSPRPVRTFSIGFRDPRYDEAGFARAVARHLGTDHTELYVDPAHALEVIPSLARWFDEPFADSSQIPTYLVSELARRHVTVSLSGDGGDELFAGYLKYAFTANLWDRIARLPAGLRRLAAGLIDRTPPGLWDLAGRLAPGRLPRPYAFRMRKLAQLLREASPDAVYRRMVTYWEEPESLVPGARESRGALWDDTLAADLPGFLERMQYRDQVTYLPEDILAKVDRASMAVSLEARVPLLDHRVVELSWRLPRRMKLRGRTSKWLLRRVLDRYVPRELVERPKMGFSIPLDAWLRGPLRPWAEELLSEARLKREGFLDPARVRAEWDLHLSGKRNREQLLWGVLMFEAWLDGAARPAPAPADQNQTIVPGPVACSQGAM